MMMSTVMPKPVAKVKEIKINPIFRVIYLKFNISFSHLLHQLSFTNILYVFIMVFFCCLNFIACGGLG